MMCPAWFVCCCAKDVRALLFLYSECMRFDTVHALYIARCKSEFLPTDLKPVQRENPIVE